MANIINSNNRILFSSDRPRLTRPKQQPLVVDSGSAPEMVTLSSRATRVRSAKLKRAAAFTSDQPSRTSSRRRMRRRRPESRANRRHPAKVRKPLAKCRHNTDLLLPSNSPISHLCCNCTFRDLPPVSQATFRIVGSETGHFDIGQTKTQ